MKQEIFVSFHSEKRIGIVVIIIDFILREKGLLPIIRIKKTHNKSSIYLKQEIFVSFHSQKNFWRLFLWLSIDVILRKKHHFPFNILTQLIKIRTW